MSRHRPLRIRERNAMKIRDTVSCSVDKPAMCNTDVVLCSVIVGSVEVFFLQTNEGRDVVRQRTYFWSATPLCWPSLNLRNDSPRRECVEKSEEIETAQVYRMSSGKGSGVCGKRWTSTRSQFLSYDIRNLFQYPTHLKPCHTGRKVLQVPHAKDEE